VLEEDRSPVAVVAAEEIEEEGNVGGIACGSDSVKE